MSRRFRLSDRLFEVKCKPYPAARTKSIFTGYTVAQNNSEALDAAKKKLQNMGYNPDNFAVMVTRSESLY